MKIKTNELGGKALDWAVAKAIGEYKPVAVPSYSTDWSQGGPIIAREKINLRFYQYRIGAFMFIQGQPGHSETGDTPLIAAMRCYVASKLGDEVEVPEELV